MTLPAPTPPITPKPGIQTTEFWVTILTIAATIIAYFNHGNLPASSTVVAGGASGLAAAVYAISRALVKSSSS